MLSGKKDRGWQNSRRLPSRPWLFGFWAVWVFGEHSNGGDFQHKHRQDIRKEDSTLDSLGMSQSKISAPLASRPGLSGMISRTAVLYLHPVTCKESPLMRMRLLVVCALVAMLGAFAVLSTRSSAG